MSWINTGKALPNEGQLVDVWLDSGGSVRVRRARFLSGQFIDVGVGDGIEGAVLRVSSWREFQV